MTVRREIAAFDDSMVHRPALIALNKTDLVAPDDAETAASAIRRESGLETFSISAEHRIGLEPLIHAVAGMLRSSEGMLAECRN
jgi:GTP-binding protein